MTVLFLALVALGVLFVDVMSLKALFQGGLSRAGQVLFAGAVAGPPVAVALAWILHGSSLRLDSDLGVSQQRWLITSLVGFSRPGISLSMR